MPATTGTPIGAAMSTLAAADPEASVLTCGPVTLSRRELEERANQFAWALLDHHVGVGDRVAIVLPNSIDFVIAVIATWKAGGTPVPVAPRMPAPERAGILALAEPKVIIAETETETQTETETETKADAETGWIILSPSQDGVGHPVLAPPTVVPQPWKVLASGGSTGKPKLIATTDPGVVERAGLYGLAAQMSQDKVALVTAPLTHNGPFMALTAALLFGNHVVLMERFNAAEVLRLTTEHRVDWIYAVPTMMHRIWRLPETQRAAADLSSVRIVFHLGAPISPWLKQSWIDWLGPEKIWELYAGTEAQAATLISGTEWLAHRGSVGRPLSGEIQIRDSTGRPLGPDEIGEVWMRSGSTDPTYTYIGATARSEGGWESLGDLGRMDSDGYLYLTDRDSDMILVGGSNVYPAEIEGALEEHPAVRSAAVIGLPDEDLGSVPHAIVQTDSDLDEADLRAHLRARLAGYKLPRTFERVSESLRDDAGKIRRSALRAARLHPEARA